MVYAKLVMALILGAIVLVASFVVVATLIMLVLERSQEIAVLKSMDAELPSVMKIFVAEGLIIGAIGTILGLAFGYGSCLAIEKFGVPSIVRSTTSLIYRWAPRRVRRDPGVEVRG